MLHSWSLTGDVGILTALLESSPSHSQTPTPGRRLVFGTAPFLDLEGVSLPPGIENRLRTVLLVRPFNTFFHVSH